MFFIKKDVYKDTSKREISKILSLSVDSLAQVFDPFQTKDIKEVTFRKLPDLIIAGGTKIIERVKISRNRNLFFNFYDMEIEYFAEEEADKNK